MELNRQALGRWGEDQAESYLVGRGYAILALNVRTPYDEIDLIARQDCGLEPGLDSSVLVTVFVEVKTRTTTTFGLPEEAVNRLKQARLLASAQAYLQEHPELGGDWRIDVIAVQRSRQLQTLTLHHFENAVSETGPFGNR